MATTPRPTASGANRATRRASSTKAKPAAAKAAPKKPTAKVEDLEPQAPKSAAHVTLEDLDAEVAEILDFPPFTFDPVGDGNEEDFITIGSPGEIPYSIVSSGNMDAVFAHAMSDEDWNKFVDADLTTAQAGLVFAMWRRHYGTGNQGE